MRQRIRQGPVKLAGSFGIVFGGAAVVSLGTDNDGNRVYVFVEVMADGRCAIATDAFTRFGHVVIEYKDMDSEFFARNLKTLERQVVYAWRELAD